MRPRYLLAIAHAPCGLDAGRLARDTGLAMVFDRFPLLLLANPACRRPLLDKRGVVLGTLFWRHGPPRPIDAMDDNEAGSLLVGAEDGLLDRCWGGYISAIPIEGRVRIMRDPSGLLPCYYAVTPVATIFASDVDLLLKTGLVAPAINWPALARHHYSRGMPTQETALCGIDELLPGFGIVVSGPDPCQQPRWSPWQLNRYGGEWNDQAIERLRRVVAQAVQGWASSAPRLLVSVSGGLDSSIVAACLARSGRDVQCLTMYTDDPAGDERSYARALCAHLDLPLAECRFHLEDIDIDVPVSPHLPRPIGRTLAQAYERAHLETARMQGIDAFVTGNGGDNVFAYSQSAAAIADRYLTEGLTTGVVTTLRDVCRQTGCGPGVAIRAAWRARRRRRYRWRMAPMFLDRDTCAAIGAIDHPWLDAPPDALPGKAAHVAGLLRMQHNLEPGRSVWRPVLTPLASQPVVEACLAIPSWAWRAGGIDRAIARHAFAADLPEPILRRRTKGGPDGFGGAIIARHRDQIRTRLLDGQLATQHIVDRPALEARFCSDQPLTAEEQVRILDLLDTEAWLGTWTRRLATITARPQLPEDRAASPNV